MFVNFFLGSRKMVSFDEMWAIASIMNGQESVAKPGSKVWIPGIGNGAMEGALKELLARGIICLPEKLPAPGVRRHTEGNRDFAD